MIYSRRDFFKISAMAAAGAFAFLSTGCGTQKSSKAKDLEEKLKNGNDEVISFTDSCGREVALPKNITTVSPSGAYAQILLATLCPDKLVSLSGTFSKSQMKYLPSRLADLPALGKLYGQSGNLNYESLIKLSPDIIIDVGERKSSIEEDMDGLQEKTGIPVIFVEGTIDKFASAYDTLGQVLGETKKASELSSYITNIWDFASAHRDEIESRDIRVMYSKGEKGYEVKKKDSVHAAVLEAVGVVNVAEIDDSNSTEVSPERVMEWDPDVLLLSSEDGFFEDIYDDKVWASISAVKNKRVYEVPTGPYEWLDMPPSIQQTLGIVWLGNLLASDIYDFDMISETKGFYKLFWGCDLTDEDVKSMLQNSTFMS
ncbi:MAG: ABC transporter substrate-binding protein [Phoenicibacter congonensis]|uniref:ABC transporter substrate-binding protein n=1 Tax=Phoenicibacter congonensis TaxID=1944646 RepID=A0AA43RGB4_9ACTN|nr:ABC transporter substrate-binding protein [Phoenicibacter congonensis]